MSSIMDRLNKAVSLPGNEEVAREKVETKSPIKTNTPKRNISLKSDKEKSLEAKVARLERELVETKKKSREEVSEAKELAREFIQKSITFDKDDFEALEIFAQEVNKVRKERGIKLPPYQKVSVNPIMRALVSNFLVYSEGIDKGSFIFEEDAFEKIDSMFSKNSKPLDH
ncbi:MAG: hypothetical protein GY909_15780 [Oligoflexia bacterium]|nr:hypothetical protein [Oligoflexia bacterium]